jgi:hypothetical protein
MDGELVLNDCALQPAQDGLGFCDPQADVFHLIAGSLDRVDRKRDRQRTRLFDLDVDRELQGALLLGEAGLMLASARFTRRRSNRSG